MSDDLRAWMQAYQAGSLTAFDRVYETLAPAIRRYMQRHTFDAARVDDLVQETFLQLHRARHTYDPAYPVQPWAMAIARHVWLMHRRAAARRPRTEALADEAAGSVRAEADVFGARAAVRAALRLVPGDRRRPLIWHHVWGVSFRDIAARLGIRENAARLRSSRGMADLRRLLGGAAHD